MRRFSYTAAMTKEFSAQRLDVKAFAQAGGRLAGHDSLLKYERLAQEAKGLHPDLLVDWEATGEIRTALGGMGQVWLHIKVRASFPMECQRCLTPVDVPLEVDREFRFVADETQAAAEDEEEEAGGKQQPHATHVGVAGARHQRQEHRHRHDRLAHVFPPPLPAGCPCRRPAG